MKVWIVDDIGYPSGFAGGLFMPSGSKHDLSMQALSIDQSTSGRCRRLAQAVRRRRCVSATALSPSGSRIAIPIASGSIDWTAPAGDANWTVLLVSHVFRTSPTKSDTNPTHAKDASQPLEDYLNPAATAA